MVPTVDSVDIYTYRMKHGDVVRRGGPEEMDVFVTSYILYVVPRSRLLINTSSLIR